MEFDATTCAVFKSFDDLQKDLHHTLITTLFYMKPQLTKE